MAPVDIHINEYSSDEEIRRLAGILIDGGPELLQKALEKMDPKGRINLTGRVGFYNLKAIRSRPTATGRRIIAITDRPMGFLEMYFANPSQDYRTGILILDLIKNKKGKEEGHGSLLYAAKLRIENNILQVEYYSIEPVSLRNVRKW